MHRAQGQQLESVLNHGSRIPGPVRPLNRLQDGLKDVGHVKRSENLWVVGFSLPFGCSNNRVREGNNPKFCHVFIVRKVTHELGEFVCVFRYLTAYVGPTMMSDRAQRAESQVTSLVNVQ